MAFFLTVTILFKHSILIICHGSHFSFSNFFLNVARYTLFAKSWTNFLTLSICVFFRFKFFLSFFKALFRKTIKIAVDGNVPGNIFVFYLSPSLSCLAVLDHFPRQIWNFRGPKFRSKMPNNTFFLTNQFSILVSL